jgi:hypothetical protein
MLFDEGRRQVRRPHALHLSIVFVEINRSIYNQLYRSCDGGRMAAMIAAAVNTGGSI